MRQEHKSLSPLLSPDSDLLRLAALWPELPETLRKALAVWNELPEPIRAAVLALVGTAGK
jgi:hypothetical protein